MARTSDHEVGEEVYLAGEKVRPGIYWQIGGDREIRVDKDDTLPASLDGRVACYVRVGATWGQMSEKTPALV